MRLLVLAHAGTVFLGRPVGEPAKTSWDVFQAKYASLLQMSDLLGHGVLDREIIQAMGPELKAAANASHMNPASLLMKAKVMSDPPSAVAGDNPQYVHKMTNFIKALGTFRKSPWDEGSINNQMRYMNALRKHMTNVESKLHQYEMEKANELIFEINDKEPEFKEKERNVNKAYNDFNKGWQKLVDVMAAKGFKWDQLLEKNTDEAIATNITNIVNVESLMDNVNTELGTLETLMKFFADNWKRLQAPLETEIDKDILKFKIRYKLLKDLSKKKQKAFNNALLTLGGTHNSWRQFVKNKVRSFTKEDRNVARILERLPEVMEKNDDKVIDAIKDEMGDRVSNERQFKKNQAKLNEKAENEIKKYRDIHEQRYDEWNDVLSEQGYRTALTVQADVKSYEEDATDILKSIEVDKNKKIGILNKKQSATDDSVKELLDGLSGQASEQMLIAQEAENALRRVTKERFAAYKEVKENLDEQLEDMKKGVDQKIDEDTGYTLKELQGDLQRLGQGTQRKLSKALNDATPGIRIALAYLTNTVRDMNAIKTDINQLSLLQQEIDGDTLELEKSTKEEGRSVDKLLHDQDDWYLSKALKDMKNVKGDVEKKMKGLFKAKDELTSSLQNIEAQGREAFKEKLDAGSEKFAAEAQEGQDAVESLNGAARQAALKMEAQIGSVGDQITKVAQDSLPDVKKNFDSYVQDVHDTTYGLEHVADNAIGKAMKYVSQHMENANNGALAALGAASDVLAPLLAADEHQIRAADHNFIDQITSLNGAVTSSVDDIADKVKATEDANKHAAESLQAARTSLMSSYSGLDGKWKTVNRDLMQSQQAWASDLLSQKEQAEEKIQVAAKSISDRGLVAEKKAQDVMDTGTDQAKNELSMAEKSMQEDVEGVDGALAADGSTLVQGATELKAVMAAADAKKNSMGQTGQADLKALQDKVATNAAADEEAVRANQREMAAAGDQVLSAGMSSLEAADKAGTRDVANAETAAQDAANQARAEMHRAAEEMERKMDALSAASAEDVAAVGHDVHALKTWLDDAEAADAERSAKIAGAFEKINAEGAEKEAEFSKKMKAAGAAMAALVGEDNEAMQALIRKLDATESFVKKNVSAQGTADEELLHKILEEAKAETAQIRAQIMTTQQQLDRFNGALLQVEQDASDAIEQASKMKDDLSGDLLHSSRQFVRRLEEERSARRQQAEDIRMQCQVGMNHLAATLEAVEDLELKTTATVKYHLGLLNLEEQKSTRAMVDAMELKAYTDGGVIDEVATKLNKAEQMEDELAAWRSTTEKKAERFQGLVNSEFSDLGHDLDLSKMELAEQVGMEKWQAEAQLGDLKAHLGHDVENLSAASEARLAGLASDTAKQIAALHADESLTEEQRAAMIAKIKADAKDRASHILQEDGRLKLEQDTADRHLQVAIKEVQDTTEHLTDLEEATGPAPGVAHVMDRIRDMLDQAKQQLFDQPPPLGGSVVPGSGAPTAMEDPEALLQTTAAQQQALRRDRSQAGPAGDAAAAVAEDADLERLLDRLT